MAVYKKLGHGTPVGKRKAKKLRQEKFAHNSWVWNSTKFITFTFTFTKDFVNITMQILAKVRIDR